MRCVAISGSARQGNTQRIVDACCEGVLSAGASVEKFPLNALTFSPCQMCEELSAGTESCVLDDDLKPVLGALRDDDVVIFATPIYFGSMSAQLKMLIDRFQCFWHAQQRDKKDLFPVKRPGAFIAVAAQDKESYFDNARSIVKNAFCVLNVDYQEELFCPDLDSTDDLDHHPEYREQAYELGKRLIS